MTDAFQPTAIPLVGVHLIEASAGTGKTYTLTTLYARCLLEGKSSVDNMLVVTFTNAAVDDLREKTQQRLKQLLRMAELQAFGNLESCELDSLLVGHSLEHVQKTLRQALEHFHQVQIFTIHSFVQRVLQESAFDCNQLLAFDLAPSKAQRQELQLAAQFWREQIRNCAPYMAIYLTEKSITPATLLQSIKSLYGLPDSELDPHADFVIKRPPPCIDALPTYSLSTIFEDLDGAKAEMLEAMQRNELNGNKYSSTKIEHWFARVAQASSETLLYALVLRDPKMSNNLSLSTIATNKGKAPPQHPFFAAFETFCQFVEAQNTQCAAQVAHWQCQLIEYLRQQLPQLKRQRATFDYDDLLLQLHQALCQTPKLAETLRQKYPVALIDEFQDTDTIQYHIFQQVYLTAAAQEQNTLLVLVGDPKQAIYGFRGADIYAYLQARAHLPPASCHTLQHNFRSTPELIAQLNQLYSSHPNPFVQEELQYVTISSGHRIPQCRLLDAQQQPQEPIDWWRLPEKPLGGKRSYMQQIVQAVAADIYTKLQQGLILEKKEQPNPLQAKDIAVLVRSNQQAETLVAELKKYQISAAYSVKKLIYNSDEAHSFAAWLRVMAQPNREQELSLLLALDLYGYSAREILAWRADNARWLQLLERFQRYHQLWLRHGFISAFKTWWREEMILARLLAQPEAERRIANWNHLSELAAQEYASKHPYLLEQWLQLQMKSSEEEDEAKMRMETDDERVQVITIHRSKGLQFPIVYIPFMGIPSQSEKEKLPVRYHQEHRLIASFVPQDDEALNQAQQESKAEDQRLLYVALTRAEAQCIVVAPPLETDKYSPLAELLNSSFAAGLPMNALAEMVPEYPAPVVRTEHYAIRYFSPQQPCQRPDWQISSYSGLMQGKHQEPQAQETELFSALLFDDPVEEVLPHPYYLPAGTAFGSCMHACFEQINFAGTVEDFLPVAEINLQRYQLDASWAPVLSQLLWNTLHTQLPSDCSLAQVQRKIQELHFYFPVEQLHIESVTEVVQQFMPPAYRAALPDLYFLDIHGFLEGFIDLVFESHGKYYIVDFKSNHLGYVAEDYQPDRLMAEMTQANYWLQALIYAVALNRYLKQRQSDYDPVRDFGGVIYLFTRGMEVDRPEQGVWFHRPDAQLLTTLDYIMTYERNATEELLRVLRDIVPVEPVPVESSKAHPPARAKTGKNRVTQQAPAQMSLDLLDPK